MFSNKQLLPACLLLMTIGVHFQALSQETSAVPRVRRHFAIAYDISAPFLHKMTKTKAFGDSIVSLFTKADPTMFDPSQDEISFYYFGIAKNEFALLQKADTSLSEKEKLQAFYSHFIKTTGLRWSNYRLHKKSITDFFTDAFHQAPAPKSFGQGITLSYYVYPLIMGKMQGEYAEDYVLLVVSDFLTGSDFGNQNDFLRILELYGDHAASPPLIKAYADSLRAGFYRIDYPYFTVSSAVAGIGALAYIIKPKLGRVSPETYSLIVDGNLKLEQEGYNSQVFALSSSTITFAHNQHFEPEGVRLRILQDKNGVALPIADTMITTNDTLLQTYSIPSLSLRLPEIRNDNIPDRLTLEYTIVGGFTAAPGNTTGYFYVTSRTLDKEQIYFSSSIPSIMMYYIIPAIALLLLAWILTRLGRTKGLQLKVKGFTESFEKVGGENHGRQNTAYTFWAEALSSIPCLFHIRYTYPGYWFNWKSIVRLTVEAEKLPKGFEVYLKASHESNIEYYPDKPLAFQTTGSGHSWFKFVLEIRQNNGYTPILSPELVRLKLHATTSRKYFWGTITSRQSTEIPYVFHLGPDLGETWVGFDPGTTGSCIAAGSMSDNILIGKFGKDQQEIVDSKILFDTTLPFQADPTAEKIPAEYYKYGLGAVAEFGTPAVVSFQSMKKLLGFMDRRTIRFSNGVEISMNGKQLCSLLIDGVYSDFRQTVEADTANNRDLLREGRFQPQRAVIAVPNNFTSVKIKDMLECVDYLGQFKEIRYVYEAEAIFFYYLYNYRLFNDTSTDFANETVLIFDMGGATINVTVIKASKDPGHDKYKVDILSKLGYGIGGDTIDYCLIRSILDHPNDFPTLRFDTPFGKGVSARSEQRKKDTDTVIALQKMAYDLKLKIIQNYGSKAENLLIAGDLDSALENLRKSLNIRTSDNKLINIRTDSDLYAPFKEANSKLLFQNAYFKKYIYENIEGITQDILDLTKGTPIGKVIFSGRSCQFPLVKETVRDVCKKNGIDAKFIALSLAKAKTAVSIGACWYGLNRNAVELNNLKTNASFGIQRRTGAMREDIEYIELLAAAKTFNNGQLDGMKYLEQITSINDKFVLDNNKVNFYQVMGKNAAIILSQNQRHKFSKIAAIPIDMSTAAAHLRVYENDIVECAVKLESQQTKYSQGVVWSQEIADANDEHYTWIIQ